jgi:hypothetical protein
MLVRAEVLSESALETALDTQRKTLRRLGDILIEQGAVDQKTIKAIGKLQTTETIYRLFLWDSGHYEFKQAEVVVDEATDTIRSENVLMEGFRQVDEWPAIRRRITGYGMRFEKLEDLDTLTAEASMAGGGETDELDIEAAFGEAEEPGAGGDSRLKNIGQNERIVYQLLQPDRDVQKLIDLSRLGEFETCKALVTLMEAHIIDAEPEAPKRPSAAATVGGIHAPSRSRWAPAVTRVVLYAALIGAGIYGGWWAGFSPRAWIAEHRAFLGYTQVDLQAEMSRAYTARLRYALEVYHAEHGQYPRSLDSLVRARIVKPRDIRFPWAQPYHYAKKGDGYSLLRPLY